MLKKLFLLWIIKINSYPSPLITQNRLHARRMGVVDITMKTEEYKPIRGSDQSKCISYSRRIKLGREGLITPRILAYSYPSWGVFMSLSVTVRLMVALMLCPRILTVFVFSVLNGLGYVVLQSCRVHYFASKQTNNRNNQYILTGYFEAFWRYMPEGYSRVILILFFFCSCTEEWLLKW